jgi:ribosome-associated translation inhibitor RaiA
MHTPLRITFQNTPSSDAIRTLIEEQAEHLEQFFGRMTACHVVFSLPDGNHRSGGLYEVAVHIKMPGGTTIDVDRTPGLDERFSDPQFAVTDAFRRASRRLKDRAKVLRHDVKSLHKRLDRDLDQPPEKTG